MKNNIAYKSGELGTVDQVISTEIIGKTGTLADDGVLTTEFAKTGLYLVSAGDNSTIVAVVDTAGTLGTELLAVNTNFTVAVDTDAKANVYIAGGFVTVQNKLGTEEDVTVKAYL